MVGRYIIKEHYINKWGKTEKINPGFSSPDFYYKIRKRKADVLSAIRLGLGNGRIEAINNKIKVTVKMGYGFRNVDNLIALLMLKCSPIKPILPFIDKKNNKNRKNNNKKKRA